MHFSSVSDDWMRRYIYRYIIKSPNDTLIVLRRYLIYFNKIYNYYYTIYCMQGDRKLSNFD